jgi:hypothetical protein
LWLTSLQKCPYCAEWVERGIERCPLCGNALATEEPFYTSEEADSTELLLNEVRENIFAKNSPDEGDHEREVEPEPLEEPFFQAVPREAQQYQEPSSDPFESQEGLGVLRERQRDEIPLDPIDERADLEVDGAPKRPRIRIPIGKMFSWFVLVIAAVAVIAVTIYVFQEFDPLTSLGIGAAPISATTTSSSATETVVTQPTTTYVAATLPPLPTSPGDPGECLLWSEISNAMEGQEVCAYGIIKRRFRVDSEIPYMAIFSEDEGTFAIVDRLTFYTQFRPGDCIQAIGEIELMRGVRPFIDAGKALSVCPAEE